MPIWTIAIALANHGARSLALSFFSHDPQVVRRFVLGAGAFHDRIVIIDRDSARESTGHGSPLPRLILGGPGRAGGGEKMGGVRGVKRYMQRSALHGCARQSDPGFPVCRSPRANPTLA